MSYKKKIKVAAGFIAIVVFLCAAMVLLLDGLVHHPAIQGYVLKRLSESTGYHIQAKNIRLSLKHGIGIRVRDLKAESAEKTEHINAAELSVFLNPWELLEGDIVPYTVFISRPYIELHFSGTETHNSATYLSLFKKIIDAALVGLRSAIIEQGRVHIKGLPFEVKELHFDVSPAHSDANRIQIRLLANAVSKTHITSFGLVGDIAAGNRPSEGPVVDLKLDTKKFPLSWLSWSNYVSFRQGLGEAHITLEGASGGPIKAKGSLFSKEAQFSLNYENISKSYSEKDLRVDFTAHYDADNRFEVSSARLSGRDFSISGNTTIDFKTPSNPLIGFNIQTPFMPVDRFMALFPSLYLPNWVEKRIFPLFSDGQARLHHFSMNGSREQMGHLHIAENKEIIGMRIDWKDATVLKDAEKPPFENVIGGVTLEKDTLETNLSHAVFGNSTIQAARLTVNDVYQNPMYTLFLDGAFDLNDIKKQEGLHILPLAYKQFLNKFSNVSGRLDGKLTIGFKQGWADLKIQKAILQYQKCAFSHPDLYLPLVLDKAIIEIRDHGKTLVEGTGQWGQSSFLISGSGETIWDLESIKIQSKLHVAEALNYFYPETSSPLSQQHRVPFRAVMKKNKDTFSCHGEIDLAGLTFGFDRLSITPLGEKNRGYFNFDLEPGAHLRLNELKFCLMQSDLELNGDLWWRKKKGFDMRVSAKKLHLNDLEIQYNHKDMQASGTITCETRTHGLLGKLQDTSFTGNIKGQDIAFSVAGMPASFNKGKFEWEFKGDRLIIHSTQINAGESPLEIQGNLQGWPPSSGALEINSKYLDISDVLPKKALFKQHRTEFQSLWQDLDLKLRLTAAKGQWRKIRFSPMDVECEIRSGDFQLQKTRFRTTHGEISLSGRTKGGKDPEKHAFVAGFDLNNQPLQDIEDSLGMERDLEGMLSLKATLSTTAAHLKDLTAGLSGQAELTLTQGLIKRQRSVLFKILEILNIQNIIHRRMPDLKTKGFSFEALEAKDIHIKQGTLKTDAVVFKSPVFNAAAQGTARIPTGMVDFDVWVQTFETMDSLVAKVPIIGYILTKKENSPKGIIIYPYEIEGHWTDPEIKSAVLKNIGPGVINIFKNILLSPGVIFRWVSPENDAGSENFTK